MKTVFMGTPDFAVPSLRALLEAGHQVQAVFCQPDRPVGRSRQPVAPPVKKTALAQGLTVHQPRRIRARRWRTILEELAPDLIVVAAFGQILPRAILDIPKIDCINVHASLLPRWRGASPIHHAILAGDKQTGVAIMKMAEALDAGPVYHMVSCDIGIETGRLALEKELACLGAGLLIEEIPKLAGKTPIAQDPALVTYAPVIQKEMGYCCFSNQTALQISAMMRAFEDWPGVWAQFRGKRVKLISGQPFSASHQTIPGALASFGRKIHGIACANGSVLQLQQLQVAGKKPMDMMAFVNGYRPQAGETFASLSEPVED